MRRPVNPRYKSSSPARGWEDGSAIDFSPGGVKPLGFPLVFLPRRPGGPQPNGAYGSAPRTGLRETPVRHMPSLPHLQSQVHWQHAPFLQMRALHPPRPHVRPAGAQPTRQGAEREPPPTGPRLAAAAADGAAARPGHELLCPVRGRPSWRQPSRGRHGQCQPSEFLPGGGARAARHGRVQGGPGGPAAAHDRRRTGARFQRCARSTPRPPRPASV